MTGRELADAILAILASGPHEGLRKSAIASHLLTPHRRLTPAALTLSLANLRRRGLLVVDGDLHRLASREDALSKVTCGELGRVRGRSTRCGLDLGHDGPHLVIDDPRTLDHRHLNYLCGLLNTREMVEYLTGECGFGRARAEVTADQCARAMRKIVSAAWRRNDANQKGSVNDERVSSQGTGR